LAKLGRPKKDVLRENQVMVRFTDAEYQRLKDCAAQSNLTVAETIRKGIIDIIGSEK
jgi:hypothetical protein